MSTELRFVYKGNRYLGIISKISGAGNNTMHDLMVENRFYGQLWMIEGTWRYGGCLDEIGSELCQIMKQIEHAKSIHLPTAIQDIADDHDLLTITHDVLAEWWQESGWLYYPVDRGEVVGLIRNCRNLQW